MKKGKRNEEVNLLAVRATLLAGSDHHVHKATVVLQSLAGAAFRCLGLVLLGYFGSLATHFTSTSERAVNLSCREIKNTTPATMRAREEMSRK